MGTDHLKGKRGKKGGTRFPRYSLKHLVSLLDSFLGKTHTSTITIEQLSAGVFNMAATSPNGKTKYSAMKQFGLAEGDYKKINSTDLCSDIAMNDGEARITNLQIALKKVKPFADALKTFQNSTVEKTKIGQYAVSTLKVHPDLRDDFIKMFIESCEQAGLCSVDGQSVSFEQNPDLDTSLEEELTDIKENSENQNTEDKQADQNDITKEQTNQPTSQSFTTKKQGNSNINVNIDVDPSMDPEKLEKLLKLLKGYGAI